MNDKSCEQLKQTKVPKQSFRRLLMGKVISNKMNKTITVLVDRRVKHPLYGKMMTSTKKYHAHDEDNEAKKGDFVEIQEGRPISKTKSWRMLRILNILSIG